MSDPDARASAALGGAQRTIRAFQASPYQFVRESSLQAVMYADIRAGLEAKGQLLKSARPYSAPAWANETREIAVVQTESSTAAVTQKGNRYDIAIFDPGRQGTTAFNTTTITVECAIELKFQAPENRRLDPRSVLGEKDSLVTDWVKLVNANVPRPLALYFVTEDGELGPVRGRLISATSVEVDEVRWGQPYCVTPSRVWEVSLRV